MSIDSGIARKRRAIVHLILPLTIMLALVACKDKPIKPRKTVALIVFVQSDLKMNKDSDYGIFKSIRDEKIAEAVKQNIKECPEITSVEIRPLGFNTIVADDFANIDQLGPDYDYDKNTKIEQLLLNFVGKYGQYLDASTDNNCQDIVGAYYFLKGSQDRYSKYDEIRVVFISDMIHYLSTLDDYDLNTDNITFKSLACLEAFKRQIEGGKIKTKSGYVDMQKLYKGKNFIVSVIKPSLSGERASNNETRTYDINDLWKEFFTKIGATEVKMNM